MAKESETKQPTTKELQEIIKSEQADQLMMLEECGHFEVRKYSYDTKHTDAIKREKGKQTLLVDVTSIANSGGGYIFIGLDTELKTNQRVEYVSKISGTKEELIHLDSWASVIPEYTVPRLSFNTLKHGYLKQGEKAVFWLKVPNAKELGLYPILVKKARWDVDENNLLKGNLFGLFHRDGSENLMESPEKIQQILASNTKTDFDSQQITVAQFQELSSQIEELSKKTPTSFKLVGPNKVKPFLENANEKLESDKGYFYIYAEPIPSTGFQRFWDTQYPHENIYTKIKNPPTLRRMGWGLEVAGSEFPYPNGVSWEIMNGQRKLLQVTQTGEVFGAISIGGVLSWGTDKYLAPEVKADVLVTELALIEYIYNFCAFLKDFKKQGHDIREFKLKIGFEVPDGTRVGLLRAERISVLWYKPEGVLGKHRNWEQTYDILLSPEDVAAQIALDVVMGGFGVTEQPISVTKNASDRQVINLDFYKTII